MNPAKAVTQFDLGSLAVLTQLDVRLSNTAMPWIRQLPQALSESQMRLQELNSGLLSTPFEIGASICQSMSAQALLSTFHPNFNFTLLQLSPNTPSIIIEIESNLVKLMIAQLTGSKASDQAHGAPLSDIDLGIFQFILLKNIAVLQQTAFSHTPNKLTLSKISARPADIEMLYGNSSGFFSIASVVQLGSNKGSLRVLIPESLMLELSTTAWLSSPIQKKTSTDILKRIGGFQLPLIVSTGNISLNQHDIQSLESDDIIILEGASLSLNNDVLSGKLTCSIGEDDAGSIGGTLVTLPSGRYGLRVSQVTALRKPHVEKPK